MNVSELTRDDVPAVGERRGLASADAARLLAAHGRNELRADPGPTILSRVGHQLRDPMILLLCGAFALVVAVGDRPDAAIIAAVVVLNTVIGVVQDVRAQHAIDALSRMAAPVARAWRDGELVEIPAADLVPGDVVRLEAGDVVPADLSLVEAAAVEVDEAAMTGESIPVTRTAGEELLSGTVVTRGRGVGAVVRTGGESALGRIAALVGGRVRPTPLQRRLGALSRQLVIVTGALCAVVLVLAVAQGESWTRAAILAVSLGVAAVPESLPAVVTISLALGAHRMAGRHAVVRRLPAVETLGSVTVIASDKTGTLTAGVLSVRALWTPDGECEVSGTAYGRRGRCHGNRARLGRAGSGSCATVPCATTARWLRGRQGSGGRWGTPSTWRCWWRRPRSGVTAESLADWHRLDETPFDSAVGYASTVHRAPDGRRLEVVKGAPEIVLALLEPDPVVDQARAEAERLAGQGHRVLAIVEDRAWVGLVAVADPPHPAAAGVVDRCRAAGIRTVLITGDHPATARAVAEQVGILRGGAIVDGDAVARGEHIDESIGSTSTPGSGRTEGRHRGRLAGARSGRRDDR